MNSTNHTTKDNIGRILRGLVVSKKMKDTVTVMVERYVKHPKYKKYQKRTKKYLVDDKGNQAIPGSHVRIKEVAPISKRKCFVLMPD